MENIIKFPPTIEAIFKSIEQERMVTGEYTVNKRKYDCYCNALQNINKYGENHNAPVQIRADDPRKPYTSHSLYIYFDTNEFEDEDLPILSEIIKGFDTLTFLQTETGNVNILLIMEDIYTAD